MSTIPQVCEALTNTLTETADKMASETGFVQRRSKLSGANFVMSLVFGWLKHPDATLEQLVQTIAGLGVRISPQGLSKRFSPQAAECLRGVLEAAVEKVIATDSVALEILRRFNGVYVQDSTVVVLPDELAEVWSGCGGSTSKGTSSSVKLQVRLDLSTGAIGGPLLESGRSQDRNSPIQGLALPPGALRLADLGYFSLGVFERLNEEGVYWLSRIHAKTVVLDPEGNRLDLKALLASQDELDTAILLGDKKRLPCRLLATRVSPKVAQERRRKLRYHAKAKGKTVSKVRLALSDWTIFATNVPKEMLSVKEALVLSRARWQIELLFKLWKSHGKIDEWRSANPWRILCELYAKILGMLIQHWIILVSCWRYPDRSLVKASQTIRDYVVMLVAAMHELISLAAVIEQISRCLAAGCRMNRRKKAPNTYQLLMDLETVP